MDLLSLHVLGSPAAYAVIDIGFVVLLGLSLLCLLHIQKDNPQIKGIKIGLAPIGFHCFRHILKRHDRSLVLSFYIDLVRYSYTPFTIPASEDKFPVLPLNPKLSRE